MQVALSMRQPPRAGGGGYGHRQDEDPAAPRRSAVESRGAGVPSLDVKGDLTGLAAPGDATNPKVGRRAHLARLAIRGVGPPGRIPVAQAASSERRCAPPSSSFGPLLLGKVLDLNETQTSILALVFKYCDDNDLPLLDLEGPGDHPQVPRVRQKTILAEYGGMSSASVGVLLRSMVVLEQEGADVFFGELEFDVADLLRTAPDGSGVISILELARRHGQAAPVLDVHPLAARPALRASP